MMRKAFVIGVVAVLMLCVLPAVAGESDASVTERSYNNLYYVECTLPSNDIQGTNAMVFLEGSENYRVMLDYIEDPQHADIPTEDDWDDITSGQKVHMYSTSQSIYYYYRYSDPGEMYIGYHYEYMTGTQVLSSSYISFFVREGSDFNLSIFALNNNSGENAYVEMQSGINTETLSEGDVVETTFGTNSVVALMPEYNDLAVDVTYEASGYSMPNGSAVVFAVAAIIVAAAILAILVLCGLKPRWGS